MARITKLSDPVALITGASRGIGAAAARAFADAGFRVALLARNSEALAEIVGSIGPAALAIPCDVARWWEVEAAVAATVSTFGRLDVLVNNAGIIAPIGHLEHLTSDSLLPAFEVNVIGLHRMTVACLPLLKQSQGLILNAGTGAATTAMEGWTAYCTSKAAARMMSLMMDKELSPQGVRTVFCGIPPTDTMMQGEIRGAGLNPISQIPQTSLVHPDVPASVLAWIASDAGRGLNEVLVDVRDDRFKAMMPL